MNRNQLVVTSILVGAIVVLAGLWLTGSVSASGYYSEERVIIHHEAQGKGDQSWSKCMPLSAWNGHEHHKGDWKGNTCGEAEPTVQSTATKVALPTGTTQVIATPTRIKPTGIVLPTAIVAATSMPGKPEVKVTPQVVCSGGECLTFTVCLDDLTRPMTITLQGGQTIVVYPTGWIFK